MNIYYIYLPYTLWFAKVKEIIYLKAQLYFLIRRLEKSSLLSLLLCSCSPMGRPLPRLEMGGGDGDGRGGESDKEDSRGGGVVRNTESCSSSAFASRPYLRPPAGLGL